MDTLTEIVNSLSIIGFLGFTKLYNKIVFTKSSFESSIKTNSLQKTLLVSINTNNSLNLQMKHAANFPPLRDFPEIDF